MSPSSFIEAPLVQQDCGSVCNLTGSSAGRLGGSFSVGVCGVGGSSGLHGGVSSVGVLMASQYFGVGSSRWLRVSTDCFCVSAVSRVAELLVFVVVIMVSAVGND